MVVHSFNFPVSLATDAGSDAASSSGMGLAFS